MARSAVLGLPRMGPNRELKFALEEHWSGDRDAASLFEVAAGLRADGWRRAADAGVDVIPSGDHSLYDHVLDTAWAFGLVPERFAGVERGSVDGYFALARGNAEARPLEMTKWFDTNYHYLVPELGGPVDVQLDPSHWVEPLQQASELGIATRPVVLGPWSLLLLGKGLEQPLQLLDALAPAYQELLRALEAAGATAVQIDEPCLITDRTPAELEAFAGAWRALAGATGLELTLATYFDGLDSSGALATVGGLPMAELHVDLVRAPGQLRPVLEALEGTETRLSLGVVDGRNVWATDHDRALDLLQTARDALGTDRVTVATSCSLLHVPHDAEAETGIDAEVRSWLAFARQRLAEVARLAAALDADDGERDRLLAGAREVTASRRTSARTNDPAVRERAAALSASDHDRSAPFDDRRDAQRSRLGLPELPTTTIGSFPQTADIRAARRDHRAGALDDDAYEGFLRARITETIRIQEELGLDVLVHGEPERNDMVEYFGEQLEGFTFSANGWVQSYGSRCVKPPILFGDVSRPDPMTVAWWEYAQSQTDKPVKGMLTGPVTILQWSFVRDDQPERETCRQIALAVQDEVVDLERAGCAIIQIDEAALREGLPLQRARQDEYVRWAIDCFRLTAAAVRDDTQIHTHMCYSEFNDMMEHIIRLDADVISIEASRSDMEVLDAFRGDLRYPNEIGPGVYDIHSPRVPGADEMERLLEAAEQRIDRDLLWVNPDCGLKTRRWEEVEPALTALVEAAHRRRAAVTA